MNQQVLVQDISDFVGRCSYWERLQGKRIVVTGATGLIGSVLVKCLDALNARYSLGMTIYGFVRQLDKARTMFSSQSSHVGVATMHDFLTLETGADNGQVHYIIHHHQKSRR